MPFIEAFRQFQFRVGLENFCNIHVSLVPQVRMWAVPLPDGPTGHTHIDHVTVTRFAMMCM